MRRLSLIAALLLAVAGVAHAQTPADSGVEGPNAMDPNAMDPNAMDPNAMDPNAREARALFERGRELAESRRFSEAVQAFGRSLALVDRPSTVLNLAICLFALERHVEAIEALERFEASPDAAADPEGLADARRMLAHSRTAVARIVVEVAPVEATVTVDGEPVEGGAARERRVNPGPHVVRVEAPHHAPTLLEIEAAPGATLRRAVVLEPTQRPARLEVRAEGAADARILVDGRDLGGAPIELAAGSHEVRVERPGAPPVVRRVELDWNEHRALELVLPAPETPLLERPELWAIIGGTVLGVAVGLVIGLLVDLGEPGADGGSTGAILRPGAWGGEVILP